MPIKAFQALRYNPQHVRIGAVTAPPYDIISPSDQGALYARDERNVVRLELGKDFASDHEANNRYTRAHEFLRDWIREGVLIRDDAPSLYVYEQEFVHPELRKKLKRTAFFARLRLEEFGNGHVYPHEYTLSGPKADRIKLLGATRTSLSPIFGLYEDLGKKIGRILNKIKIQKPLYYYKDDDGVRHRLWRLEDAKQVRSLEQSFLRKAIFIADGHHRYETALNHSRALDTRATSVQEKENAAYTLAAFTAMEDPGLAVLPTHRLIKNVQDFTPEKILEKLSANFEMSTMSPKVLEEALRKSKPYELVLGLYWKGGARLLRLKNPGALSRLMPKDKSREWQRLDASIASELVIQPVFGITEAHKEARLMYTHFFKDALHAVERGEAQCAIVLRATPPETIKKICRLKERMPQKSTYFYPKLATGLVFYQHN
ncbi:MAG: DUF1015 domain-containing protein [Candidatus Omnitrophica bacterium]|nr:DUF1015 domain-containing protein [Candidatus Omnitrophota bacterium]